MVFFSKESVSIGDLRYVKFCSNFDKLQEYYFYGKILDQTKYATLPKLHSTQQFCGKRISIEQMNRTSV